MKNPPTFTAHILERGKYGFAESDAWDTWYYLSTIIPPMLRQMKEGAGCPAELYDNDEPDKDKVCHRWEEALEEMARGFEAVIEMDDLRYDEDKTKMEELEVIHKKGMELFVRYFRALWD